MKQTVNPGLYLWNFLLSLSVIMMQLNVTGLEQAPASVCQHVIVMCLPVWDGCF